ncbi:hypothetical protein [Hymenobacter tenuis]
MAKQKKSAASKTTAGKPATGKKVKVSKKVAPGKLALIGAGVAAVATGIYLAATKSKSNKAAAPDVKKTAAKGAPTKTKKGAAADVDVALTNEVASYTEHNPKNAANFTDDGATGNAD